MKQSHYFKTKLIKLGRWYLFPADAEAWHAEATSLNYFKKVFGFNKCLLTFCRLDDGSQYPYAPAKLLRKLYSYISATNRHDYKALDKKLRRFYFEKKKLEETIKTINPKDCKKLSTKDLITVYQNNRDLAHRIAVYDQFGWLAEDYWNPVMEKILVKKHKIVKDSPEYFEALFILTKPEEISTTLKEKRAVVLSALKLKEKKSTLNAEAKKLTKNFGWLPVFAFGEPWGIEHYQEELQQVMRKDTKTLQIEFTSLKNYTTTRNDDVKRIVSLYKINPKDQQIFTDFGLALDTRNEAEFIQSLCGFYVRPIYFEIARRLYLSIRQLRCLYEAEIITCLRGQADPLGLLHQKGKIVAFGFNASETKRINLPTSEAQKLFTYLECGSLTCHAAVVSREFGVPCIVSLKNVTKNFSDGELVEVNANLGIITKIKNT